MTSKFEGIKVGDRVRVVIEGEVDDKYGENNIDIGNNELWCSGDDAASIVSIEKIQPDYFGPGDVVRSKAFAGYVYSIGTDGYFCHDSGRFNESESTTLFPSSGYELLASLGGNR